jgi:hypothetical protein
MLNKTTEQAETRRSVRRGEPGRVFEGAAGAKERRRSGQGPMDGPALAKIKMPKDVPTAKAGRTQGKANMAVTCDGVGATAVPELFQTAEYAEYTEGEETMDGEKTFNVQRSTFNVQRGQREMTNVEIRMTKE